VKIARQSRRHVSRHGEPVILFAVGEHSFAAPANEVDEIRDLHGLESIEDATRRTSVSKISATLERSGKSYFVVSAARHFGLPQTDPSRLMVLRGQPIAVLVDNIDRMAEIEKVLPLPNAFYGQERRWYRGLALMSGTAIPVVNMSSFLTPAEQVVARSVVSRLAGKGVSA
jgi:chemotaxis signal transduction protein